MGCPEALQISWYSWGAGAGDKQIASELEVEFFEVAALTAIVGIGLEQGVGIFRILRFFRVLRFL